MPNPSPQVVDELMPIDIADATRKVTVDSKVTAIVATSTSPLAMLAWCVLSLVLRSSRDGILQSIIVAVNGPQGDTQEQDRKQAFLDDVSKCVPLTVSRVWGPIGHGDAIDSVVPWVRTQAYLLVHDDTVLLSKEWERTAANAFQHPTIAMVATPGVFGIGGHRPSILVSGFVVCERDDRAGESHVVFPHVNTVFTLCRKDLLAPLGRQWAGFSIEAGDGQAFFSEPDLQRLASLHREKTCLERTMVYHGPATRLSMDIGSWIYAACIHDGLEFAEFQPEAVKHFVAMSWRENKVEAMKRAWESPEIAALEADLETMPQLLEVYRRHVRR